LDTSVPPPTPSSVPDGAGVRVIRQPQPLYRSARIYLALALLLVGAGVAYLVSPAVTAPQQQAGTMPVVEPPAASAAEALKPVQTSAPMPSTTPPRRPPALAPVVASPMVDELPSLDPDDIAAYISPADGEPTMAEVIDGLRHAGIHDGLAAFNPPGTSPPLHGIAVPDNFVLPEGYVRHHQVTDDGEPIEPVLMFSPDYTFYDESGRPLDLPEDRVVPPELAPPGLPIRPIEIPPPAE
jgi:hypothetical protein